MKRPNRFRWEFDVRVRELVPTKLFVIEVVVFKAFFQSFGAKTLRKEAQINL